MSPTVLKTIAEALDCFQSGVLTAHRQGSSDIESFSSGVRELVAYLHSLGVVEVPEWKPTHLHVKRGSVYRVVGEAEVQVSNHASTDRAVLAYPGCPEAWRLKPGDERGLSVIQEGEKLTVYAEENGKLWTRFSDEFHDGRFAPVEKVAIKTMGPMEGWNGIAALYRLSPPHNGDEWVVVSSVIAPFLGPETFIFESNEYGEVTEWAELEGSTQGTLSHAGVLGSLGYRILP